MYHREETKDLITSIARQSVIIKCNMQKSVITGTYEYYYAAGLFSKLCGIEIAEDIRPGELQQLLKEKGQAAATGDDREAYLKKILLKYVPAEEYDMQMKELLLWGMNEENPWSLFSA